MYYLYMYNTSNRLIYKKKGWINRKIPTSSLEKEWFCRFTFRITYIDIWYIQHQDCRSSLVLYRIITASNLRQFGFSPSKWLSGLERENCLDFVYCIHEYVFLCLISRHWYTWLAFLCIYTNVIFFSCYMVKPDVYGFSFYLEMYYTIFHRSSW